MGCPDQECSEQDAQEEDADVRGDQDLPICDLVLHQIPSNEYVLHQDRRSLRELPRAVCLYYSLRHTTTQQRQGGLVHFEVFTPTESR